MFRAYTRTPAKKKSIRRLTRREPRACSTCHKISERGATRVEICLRGGQEDNKAAVASNIMQLGRSSASRARGSNACHEFAPVLQKKVCLKPSCVTTDVFNRSAFLIRRKQLPVSLATCG